MIDERSYLAVLHEELVPAQGCTEPIALAYCSAQARKALGTDPENIRVLASGNIIKNVKSVVVPGTNGRRGIETAAVFGALAGDPEKKLEVLTGMPADRCRMAEEFLEHPEKCTVEHLKTDAKLHMIVEVCGGGHVVRAELKDRHTNIVRIEKDGEDIFRACPAESLQEHYTDRSFMRLTDILRFAETVDIEKVRDCIERQIAGNEAISNDGLTHVYGSNVGKMLLETCGTGLWTQIKAAAAAGSDARMSGSLLPVVINSGSGNQGMTVSLPVIVFAKNRNIPHEQLIRALVISNLTAIHQKTRIGRLSAYCGAVSAAAGSIAGIAWLDGADDERIAQAVSNTLANVSGILCDGAKPSCAAKIAAALDAALMGYELAKAGCSFRPGDGIVKDGIEATMAGVGDIAGKGMVETDERIIDVMIAGDAS